MSSVFSSLLHYDEAEPCDYCFINFSVNADDNIARRNFTDIFLMFCFLWQDIEFPSVIKLKSEPLHPSATRMTSHLHDLLARDRIALDSSKILTELMRARAFNTTLKHELDANQVIVNISLC